MTYETWGGGALDYSPCRYGDSRLTFRGPRRSLQGDYIAFLGGTETYGRFIPVPFPALVEAECGRDCVNFGWPNGGVDAFLNDSGFLDFASQAPVTVIQVLGAQNMSNRFYRVHPRRNDRFLRAEAPLRAMFDEVDFTDFNFNRHMLNALFAASPERFQAVREELQQVWVERMRLLLNRIGGKVVLLWFAAHAPSDRAAQEGLGRDPLFVSRAMLDQLRPHVDALTEVVASPRALSEGSKGMVFEPLQAVAALEMLGPAAHEEAAQALIKALGELG